MIQRQLRFTTWKILGVQVSLKMIESGRKNRREYRYKGGAIDIIEKDG